MTPSQRLEAIQNILLQAFSPSQLEVIDESHRHVGHPGASNGAGHFKLIIASAHFTKLQPIACHRLIYQALAKLMTSEIHALSIEIVS